MLFGVVIDCCACVVSTPCCCGVAGCASESECASCASVGGVAAWCCGCVDVAANANGVGHDLEPACAKGNDCVCSAWWVCAKVSGPTVARSGETAKHVGPALGLKPAGTVPLQSLFQVGGWSAPTWCPKNRSPAGPGVSLSFVSFPFAAVAQPPLLSWVSALVVATVVVGAAAAEKNCLAHSVV